jgi:hypothetical protein
MVQPTPNPVPTDLVSVSQGELNDFCAAFNSVKTALGTYISLLVTNQDVKTGLQQAYSNLTTLAPPTPVIPSGS